MRRALIQRLAAQSRAASRSHTSLTNFAHSHASLSPFHLSHTSSLSTSCASVTAPATTAPASASDAAVPATTPIPVPTSKTIAVDPDSHFDLVVIGSGPSGQKCAIDAAKRGKRVCVIDKQGMFGGVCIHTGTIPSKTFREAILYVTAHNQRGFGGEVLVRSPNLSKDILERVQKVEQWETETILRQLHRNKVLTVQGTAKFIDPNHIEIIDDTVPNSPVDSAAVTTSVQTRSGWKSLMQNTSNSSVSVGGLSGIIDLPSNRHIVRGDKVLIACGGKPARNPIYPWDSPRIFDSDTILLNSSWGDIKNLIVVGTGVIAMEYASMFNTLPNCKVTIIDERPTFLDFIDSEVVDTLKYVMRRRGATFHLCEKVAKVTTPGESVRVELESGKVIIGDALFYAVGRQSESDNLNLANAGVQTGRRGVITVNDSFQTNIPHIYAAGDIVGFPALASTSMEQGRLCSEHMFSPETICETSDFGETLKTFPYGIYTIPEISVIGMSEQELTKKKIPYMTAKAKYEETAKGQMMGGPHIDGFLKIMFCPETHRLLGVCAIGENATELIHIAQMTMRLGGTLEFIRSSVFNYPTYAELYRNAALDGLNQAYKYNSTEAQESKTKTPDA